MMAETFSYPFMYWVGMHTAPDTELRDTEQVSLLEEGGSETLERETVVLSTSG